MKTWKKITIAIIALIVAGFGIFAWANSVSNDKKADTSKKTLIIGLEGTYAPYSYRKDGKLTGFEVELGKAVAKEMGMKAKFVPTKWDSLVAGLGTGKFDLIMNDMTPTPERAKHYDYSIPYIKSRSILIVPASSKIKELKKLKVKESLLVLVRKMPQLPKNMVQLSYLMVIFQLLLEWLEMGA